MVLFCSHEAGIATIVGWTSVRDFRRSWTRCVHPTEIRRKAKNIAFARLEKLFRTVMERHSIGVEVRVEM